MARLDEVPEGNQPVEPQAQMLAILPCEGTVSVETQPGEHAFADLLRTAEEQMGAALRKIEQTHVLPPLNRVQAGADAYRQPRIDAGIFSRLGQGVCHDRAR